MSEVEQAKKIDTSQVYDSSDVQLMDHITSIQTNLIKGLDDPKVLDGMSIDKTDSVLRIVDSIEKSINRKANIKVKLMTIQDINDDRDRLISLLTNPNLRTNINSRRLSNIELDDADIIDVPVTINKGEFSTGIEQLSTELLELEKEIKEEGGNW